MAATVTALLLQLKLPPLQLKEEREAVFGVNRRQRPEDELVQLVRYNKATSKVIDTCLAPEPDRCLDRLLRLQRYGGGWRTPP
jgi:hypothetical protein